LCCYKIGDWVLYKEKSKSRHQHLVRDFLTWQKVEGQRGLTLFPEKGNKREQSHSLSPFYTGITPFTRLSTQDINTPTRLHLPALLHWELSFQVNTNVGEQIQIIAFFPWLPYNCILLTHENIFIIPY
jgi:hypothetical protein